MAISKSKQKALDEAYHISIQVCFYDMPLNQLEPYIPEDVMNFGAGVTEITTDKETFLKQIENQKDIASGLEMEFQIDPVMRKITNEGDGAIYTDDIINTVWMNGIKNELKFRLSFIFEYVENRWMMVHSHTSAPDSQRNDDEVWPLEDLKRRTEFLEKSLEEKVAELEVKNRELEIEASLERVRTVAMAMQNPVELLNICRIVFDELQLLGFEDLRNAIIHVFEEEKDFFNDYDYSEATGGTSSQVPLAGNSVLEKFIGKIRESKDSFFEMKVSGEEFESWKAFRKTTEMHDDSKLNLAETLYYYVYSVGEASIGISSFEPIKPVQRDLLKRFRNVFELAYKRYGDIQKAEAQAREAQIEAAVERVRSRALAMHKSEEILEVAIILKREMVDLGLEGVTAATIYLEQENGKLRLWDLTEVLASEDGPYLSMDFEFSLDEIDPNLFVNEIWNSNEAYYVVEMNGEGFERSISFLEKYAPETVPGYKEFLSENNVNHSWHPAVPIVQGKGRLNLDFILPPPREVESILPKMGSAFDLAYQRFEDLRNAENQLREAQIEAALEKVRSRTMAMQSSDELPEAANLLFQQLQSLGLPTWSAGYNILSKDKKSATCWMSSEGMIQEPFTLTFDGDASIVEQHKFLTGDQDFMVQEVSGQALLRHYEFMMTIPKIREFSERMVEAGVNFPNHQINHLCKFKHGYLLFITYENVDESHDLFLKFTNAFEQTYTRFLDLQTKEEQSVKLREEKERLEKTLSDLRTTQKKLIHAEKMASLGELTAGIAHEIQNPLNFVNNFSEVSSELIEEAMDEIEAGEYDEAALIMKDLNENLQKIHHHGGRASSIVNGMLEHSRTDSGEKVKADINQLADECLRLSYHGMRAKDRDFQGTFDIRLDHELPKINIVSQDISRVLLNLINNGFQAAFEKHKKIKDDTFKPKVTISTKYHDDNIQVSVADNGPGIHEDIKDKIFQPFFTTKPTGEGTGLGLSLSYDIVKAHGGEIIVKSEKEHGSEFIIKIPLLK